MSNVNLEIPDDGTLPAGFSQILNDRMRQIQLALAAKAAATTKTVAQASTGTRTTTVTVASGALQGTHATRLATNAATLPTGTQFWETDRYSIYIVEQLGSAGTWSFAVGFDSDVNANRPVDLGVADDGYTFFATDRGALYSWNGITWSAYVTGASSGTLAAAPVLGVGDAGYLYTVTTGTGGVAYNHTFEWSGTKWTIAPGHEMGGYFRDFAFTPQEPGWHPCDGTATHYLAILSGVLTELAVTPPNATGAYRKGGAAYSATVNAAGTIDLTGGTCYGPAQTPTGTVVTSGPSATSGVPQGTGTVNTVAAPSHNHVATFTGDALPLHRHLLDPANCDARATLNADPVENIVVLAYFRR